MSILRLLLGVQKLLPDLEEFFIYGGSGGGVSSAAWAPTVADMFPMANVYALVDSGFHLMPGTDIFKYFFNNVAWSHGPGEQQAKKVYTEYTVPTFDWLDVRAIATQLHGYGGRVKIAYMGCDNDYIVYGDRKLMGQYAVTNYNDTYYTTKQVLEMWTFLENSHKCAPAGTVFSWVASCSAHHLTRVHGANWAEIERGESYAAPDAAPTVPGAISARDFVYNFLKGQPLDPNNPMRYHFWYDNRTDEMAAVDCASGSAYQEASNAFRFSSTSTAVWFVKLALCLWMAA
jgi:hypothetical protein